MYECRDVGIYEMGITGEFNSSPNSSFGKRAIDIIGSGGITVENCDVFPYLYPLSSAFGIPKYGIFADNCIDVKLEKNRIFALAAAIYINHNLPLEYTKFDIQDNDIWGQHGIWVENFLTDTASGTQLLIKNNKIDHVFTGSLLHPEIPGGITLRNIHVPYIIQDNTITEISDILDNYYWAGDYVRGLTLQLCTGLGLVENNTLDAEPELIPSTGIGIFDSRNAILIENEISAVLHDDEPPSIGIATWGSSSISFCCNTIDDTNIGTEFASANNNIKFYTTEYGAHDTALYFPPAASINKQFNTGNTWAGATTELDAFYNGDQLIAQLNAPFRTQTSNINSSKILPSGWFFLSGTDPYCGQQGFNCSDFIPSTTTTEFTNSDTLALTEVGAENEYVLRFEQQRQLYRKLKEFPELITASEGMSDFYDVADGGIIGAFDAVDQQFLNLSVFPDTLKAAFDSYFQYLDSLSTEVEQIKDAYPLASPSEKSLLLDTLGNITDEIAYALEDLDSLYALAENQYSANVAQLLEDNDALSATQTWELNEQEINVLFFKFLAGVIDTFTNTEKAYIISLAEECPQFEGAGVYKARLLRGHLVDSTFIGYNESQCLQTEEGRPTSSWNNDSKHGQIRVYPNPATDKIWIQFSNTPDKESLLILRDHTGRNILSKKIEYGSETSLNIAGIPSGIYMLSWYSNDSLSGAEKVIISR
ncbi:MAG: T9SS type A sorting domain-containing protein [Lewinellaceae bacterium]|nr:T9SS type A sorting domain-containing protein [Lewinellaceae bacterium]